MVNILLKRKESITIWKIEDNLEEKIATICITEKGIVQFYDKRFRLLK